MSVPSRTLAGFVLAILSTVSAVSAQQVNEIAADVAGHGDIVRVFGSDLGSKPKLVLVQEGAAVKKTKLKVVDSGDAGGKGGGPYVDVLIFKGQPGVFGIGVRVKKDVVGVSPDTLELRGPQPETVDPGAAQPGDEVEVLVRHYGPGGHKVKVGNQSAKVVDEQLLEGGEGPLTAVTIRVPKVPDGHWPVEVQNRLGVGVLKNALEVGGGTGKPGKVGATIALEGLPPFKANKKLIGTDEGGGDPGEVNVGLVGGSKKQPKIFGIVMPGQLADLEAGDEFTGADEIASVIYSVTNKDGSLCVWSTELNEEGEDFAIQVVSIDEDLLVLYVCGKARLAEQVSSGDCDTELVCFSGLVTAPGTPSDPLENTDCSPLTDAVGSVTGAFVSSPQRNIAFYGLAGPGILDLSSGTAAETQDGTPLQAINFRVSFNPTTDATPVTFDQLNLDGSGLSAFTLELFDQTFYSVHYEPQVPPTPATMSVTISSVVLAGPNQFGVLACIHGSFTGTLIKASVDMTPQTFTGTFEIPLYDPGFGF